MERKNEMLLEFDAISRNEGFARVAVASFVSSLNPTLEEVADIKTAVSEAVTNAIIHGYENLYGYGWPKGGTSGHDGPFAGRTDGDEAGTPADGSDGAGANEDVLIHDGKVRIHCILEGSLLHIEISDQGKGIENVEQAMEPLFTTKPELDRSGMGFAFMEAFMDELQVESAPGKGTKVYMKKRLGQSPWIGGED